MQGRPTHLRSKGEVASHYLAANPETTYEPGYTNMIGHFEDQCLVVSRMTVV